jgi:competence protein ComEC
MRNAAHQSMRHSSPNRIFRLSRTSLLLLATCALAIPFIPHATAQAHASGKDLRIYAVDVEGGQATLLVGPWGRSLLVDTGWPGNKGRDAERIAAAMKDAGITQIDMVLITTSIPIT